jgi:hypothetical protein
MIDESKKIEKIEKDAKQEVQPAELSEQDLDKVAGGQGKLVGSHSNIRNN